MPSYLAGSQSRLAEDTGNQPNEVPSRLADPFYTGSQTSAAQTSPADSISRQADRNGSQPNEAPSHLADHDGSQPNAALSRLAEVSGSQPNAGCQIS